MFCVELKDRVELERLRDFRWRAEFAAFGAKTNGVGDDGVIEQIAGILRDRNKLRTENAELQMDVAMHDGYDQKTIDLTNAVQVAMEGESNITTTVDVWQFLEKLAARNYHVEPPVEHILRVLCDLFRPLVREVIREYEDDDECDNE